MAINLITGQDDESSTQASTGISGASTPSTPNTPQNLSANFTPKDMNIGGSGDQTTTNENAIASKLGQSYDQTSGQFNAPTTTPVSTPTITASSNTTTPTETPEQIQVRQAHEKEIQAQTDASTILAQKNQSAANQKQAETDKQIANETARATALDEQKKTQIANAAANQKITDAQYQNTSAQSKTSIKAAQNTVDNLTSNMNYFYGSMGHSSTAGMQGTTDEISKAKDYLDYLDTQYNSNNTVYGQKAIESHNLLKQSIDNINSQMKADVSKSILEQLINTSKIDSVGDLDTPEAVAKAKTQLITDLQAKTAQLDVQYSNAFNLVNQTAKDRQNADDAYIKAAQSKQEFDPTLSTSTGQIMSKAGTPMLDSQGNPLQFDTNGVKSIVSKGLENGIDPATGQMSQGLYVTGEDEQIRFNPVKSPTLTPTQVGSYVAAGNASFASSPEAFKQFTDSLQGLDPQTRNSILSGLNSKAQVSMQEEEAKKVVEKGLFDTNPQVRAGAINDYVQKSMDDVNKTMGFPVTFAKSSLEVASAVERDVEKGMSIGDAMKKEFWTPTIVSPEYKDAFSRLTDAANLKLQQDQANIVKAGGGSTDLSSQGGSAAVRNNNPGNIKFNVSGFNQVLNNAGIQYTQGSNATDGGSFLKFNSVEDGLKAREMLLDKSYGGLSLEQGMRRWSGGGYGAEILPGVSGTTKIGDLTDAQKDELTMNQVKREDGNMYKQLVKNGVFGPGGINLGGNNSSTNTSTATKSDADLAADAIMNGNQPPTTTGLYGKTLAVKAAMEKAGFNFTAANEDWLATSKHIATMNGAQFTKLTTAVNFVNESIPLLQDLNKKAEDAMSKSGITQFGKIQKSVALSGAMGQEVKSAFTKLESQATEMAAELATVYKGGNSSTDKGLEQANKLFDTDWDYQTFKDNIDLVAKNIKIRQNSIKNTGTNYLGGQAQSTVTAPEQTAPTTGTSDKVSNFLKNYKFNQ